MACLLKHLIWRQHTSFITKEVAKFLIINLASPAATIKIACSSDPRKDNVLAIRAGITPIVSAAWSTVALDVSNSITSCSRFHCSKCFLTLSNDNLLILSFFYNIRIIAHFFRLKRMDGLENSLPAEKSFQVGFFIHQFFMIS